MATNIIITGEGGQGIQVLANIITTVASGKGKYTSELPSFGVEQRGGVSINFIQISAHPIFYPRFDKANIIIAFSNRSIAPIKRYLLDDTLFIYDNSAIETTCLEKIKTQAQNYVAIPAQKTATEKYSSKVANMILLGALSAHLKDFEYQEFENAIYEVLKGKIADDEKLKSLNTYAFQEGMQLAQIFDRQKQPFTGCETQEVKKVFSKKYISWTRSPEYCKGCALCITRCPVNALKFDDKRGFLGNPLPIVDLEKCIGCYKCEKICPDAAIKVDKKG